MAEYSLSIGHIYPDLLNLYGDTGNIICMRQRLAWRGIDCTVTNLTVGETIHPGEYDLFFIGGGQDFEQRVLLEDAAKYKRNAIKEAVEDEKVFLAICGGYQILGQYYEDMQGVQLPFMDCIDIYTVAKEDRMIGNCLFTCDDLDGATIVGFENHAGRTYLGKGVRPIGNIISGYGNNGEDGKEGAVYKNVYCSYSHGPMLPKNPAFCDLLLKKALERKYGSIALEKLQDDYENKAHRVMEERLNKVKR